MPAPEIPQPDDGGHGFDPAAFARAAHRCRLHCEWLDASPERREEIEKEIRESWNNEIEK